MRVKLRCKQCNDKEWTVPAEGRREGLLRPARPLGRWGEGEWKLACTQVWREGAATSQAAGHMWSGSRCAPPNADGRLHTPRQQRAQRSPPDNPPHKKNFAASTTRNHTLPPQPPATTLCRLNHPQPQPDTHSTGSAPPQIP
eukprot:308005-Chlamydomonas_euryale.AAC.1